MEQDWLKTAQEIELRLQKLDSILNVEIKTEISDVEEIDDQVDESMIGIYVAIAPYYPSTEQESNGHCPVRLGEVVKITEIQGDFGFGQNQTTKITGLMPLSVIVKLSPELVMELAQQDDLSEQEEHLSEHLSEQEPQESDSEPDEDPDQTITLEDLKQMSMDYTTHCMEALPGEKPNLYFVWKQVAKKVAVWGSFNNWSRAIPMFYDGSTEMFVAFTECEDVQEGETCIFKYSVDDEWKVDESLDIIVDEEDGSRYNTLLVCSQYYQGQQLETLFEPVRYKVLPRLVRTISQEHHLGSDDLGSAINDARIQDSIEVLESERSLQKLRDSFANDLTIGLMEPLSESITEHEEVSDTSFDIVTVPSEVQSFETMDTSEHSTAVSVAGEDGQGIVLSLDMANEIQREAENSAALLLQEQDALLFESIGSVDVFKSDTESVEAVKVAPTVLSDPVSVLEKTILLQEKLVQDILEAQDQDGFEELMVQVLDKLEETVSVQEKVVEQITHSNVPRELFTDARVDAENEEAVRLQTLDVEKMDHLVISPLTLPEQIEIKPVQVEREIAGIVEPEPMVAPNFMEQAKEMMEEVQVDAFWLPDVVRESVRLAAERDYEQELMEIDMKFMVIDIIQTTLPPLLDLYVPEIPVSALKLPSEIINERRILAEEEYAVELQEREEFVKEIVENVVESVIEKVGIPVEIGRSLQILAEEEYAVELQERDVAAVPLVVVDEPKAVQIPQSIPIIVQEKPTQQQNTTNRSLNTSKDPVMEILDDILEQQHSPRLLQVDTNIAPVFESLSSSVHDEPLIAISPMRSPSEREILILTPQSAEIIPIPSHLLPAQLVDDSEIEIIDKVIHESPVQEFVEDIEVVEEQPRSSPKSVSPAILEAAEELAPIKSETVVQETEWVEVPLDSPVEEQETGLITPLRIMAGLLLFSQYELVLSVGSFVVTGTMTVAPFTFDALRGLGYIYVFAGLLVLLKEMFPFV